MARSPRALALLTAAFTVAVCGSLVAGYYAFRARAYASLDHVLEGDFPVEWDDALGFAPVRGGASLRRHPKAGLAYHLFTSDRRARVGARGEKTPPSVDLLTVGCSFSWGHGVEHADTYTAVLADRLGVPAANLAFSAYGTVQSALMLEQGLDLRPRVVVYGVIQDHAKRNVSPCAPVYGPTCLPSPWVDFDASGAPILRAPDGASFDFNRRFWEAFFFEGGSWPRRIALAAEADLRRLRLPADGDDVGPPERQRGLAMMLARMRDATAAANAHLVVVFIPYLEREGGGGPAPALQAALRDVLSDGVTLVDLAPVVARHYADPANPLLRFDRDRHPNAAGHRLVADALEPVLRGRLGR